MALPDSAPSAAVVAQAATGDQVAFARLVDAHHASMARVAYAITGDREAAADAVQNAWTSAWRRLSAVRDPATVRAWLMSIAANEAKQVLRRQRSRPVVDISLIEEPSGGGDPADRISTVDLARVLRTLGPDDRALLALRFAAGMDSNEIATQLGLSASGARSRLARLIDRLRQELDHG